MQITTWKKVEVMSNERKIEEKWCNVRANPIHLLEPAQKMETRR